MLILLIASLKPDLLHLFLKAFQLIKVSIGTKRKAAYQKPACVFVLFFTEAFYTNLFFSIKHTDIFVRCLKRLNTGFTPRRHKWN
jgi:hypothetical protein